MKELLDLARLYAATVDAIAVSELQRLLSCSRAEVDFCVSFLRNRGELVMRDAETVSIVDPTNVLQLQMFDNVPDTKRVAKAIARHGKIGVLQANLIKEVDGMDAKQLSRFVGILQKAGAVIQTKNKYLFWAQFHQGADLLGLEKMSAWMNRKQKPL